MRSLKILNENINSRVQYKCLCTQKMIHWNLIFLCVLCTDLSSVFCTQTVRNSWTIQTTLYRVCCIEYTWLFVNAQCYDVLCILNSKCISFWHSNNLIARNQDNF